MTEYQTDYYAESLTPGQWLRRSLGWTAGCLVGVWLCSQALIGLGHYQKIGWLDIPGTLMFGSICAAHYLIWRRALPGSTAAFEHEIVRNSFSWTVLVAGLWRVALFLFQLACSLALLAWAVIELFNIELIGQFT
jgi:hypothetical protein